MKILLGGVRGTSPVAGRDFLRFGGDTTSLLVRGHEGGTIVVDAGTGIGQIAKVLRAPRARSRWCCPLVWSCELPGSSMRVVAPESWRTGWVWQRVRSHHP